jgi:hypothetical protein
MRTWVFGCVPMVALAAAMMAGCAPDGSLVAETSSVSGEQPGQKAADPVCTALVVHIEGLRKEGVADKIEKAANKKYKMTAADLTKADQLNKANADFQAKCAPQSLQASNKPAAATAAQ